MTTAIGTLQNQTINLDRLAAQSEIYTQVKHIKRVRVILFLPLLFFATLVTSMLNNSSVCNYFNIQAHDASWVIPLLSIVILTINCGILIPLIKSKKRIAATIQEGFDCSVLSIPWNKFLVGNPISPETIVSASKHRQKGKRDLSNWYPANSMAELPFEIQKYLCQRTNLSWDGGLKQRYLNCLRVFLIVGILICVVGTGLSSLQFRAILNLVIAPVLPVAALGLETLTEGMNSIKAMDGIYQWVDDFWQEALKDPNNSHWENYSRMLQDAIYVNRTASLDIPDWFYRHYRPSDEEAAVYSAATLADEYRRVLYQESKK